MTVVSIKVPDGLLDGLAWLVENGYYISRSDAIRAGIHLLFTQDLTAITATGKPHHPVEQPVPVQAPRPAGTMRRFTAEELTVRSDPSLDLRKPGAGWAAIVDNIKGGKE